MDDRVARVEQLLEEVDETGAKLVRALLELYGEGLARIVARVDATALTGDELVEHLLLLHDLHPVPVETRVREALEGVRPYLDSHGGDVELLEVDERIVRVALKGSCDGCPSSQATLKLAIEDAIHRAAPDVADVVADGVAEPAPGPQLLQLEVSDALQGESWTTAGTLAELANGGVLAKRVAGDALVFLRVEGRDYAYRDGCPGCRESLEKAELEGPELRCTCGRRYDVRRAGRGLDDPALFLEPVPLLTDDAGLVKVAARATVA